MTAKFVYVIGTATGPFKVGIANDPRSRLTGLQSGSHIKLSVLYSIGVEPSDAYAVERAAHETLNEHRLSGEWFNVPCDMAKAAIAKAAKAAAKARQERERLKALAAAECKRIEEARLATERAAIIQVDGVQLVHRVTDKEHRAEQKKIDWERDAPRRAFVQRMATGKRVKADQRRKEEERLAGDASKLQAFFSKT
jgi:hypothetical protein